MSRINTNVTSMISARVLNTQQSGLNKALQRLSTGLRINSGADDPSGLIASEVLRGEQTAMKAAIANGQRASNVISTAEGALNEVSSLLSQLEESVSSAANVSGQSSDEIAAKQLQVDSILSTINRIANSTDFEGIKLLNGTLDYTTSGNSVTSAFDDVSIKAANMADGANMTVTVEVYGSAKLADVTGTSTTTGNNTIQVTGKYGTQVFSFASGTNAAAMKQAINDSKDLTGVSAYVLSNKVHFTSTEYGSDSFVRVEGIDNSVDYTTTQNATGEDAKVRINGQDATAKGLTANLNTANLSIEVSMKAVTGTALATKSFAITGGGATFSLAADVMTGRSSIGIEAVTTGSLGDAVNGKISSLADGQENALSSTNLGKSQRIVKSAIKQVASLRGRLGAFQKLTIDSTVSSMNIALENTAAAESAVRDADFATETASMTRSQILVQAATTVLRQSNQAPQNALALLG